MTYSLAQRLYLLALQPQRRLDLDSTLQEKALAASTTYILLGITGYVAVLFLTSEEMHADLIGIVLF